MTAVVFSPHCDDAIFSIGVHLLLRDVLIVTPFAGMPPDDVGRRKYELLHTEHKTACAMIGARWVNGEFLDDVYPRQDDLAERLIEWLEPFLASADSVYMPAGIRHPDHILLSDVLRGMKTDAERFVYEELPYRVQSPDLAVERLALWGSAELVAQSEPRPDLLRPGPFVKQVVCRAYLSQTNLFGTDQPDEALLDALAAPERIWRLL